jgi:hypothetical protein
MRTRPLLAVLALGLLAAAPRAARAAKPDPPLAVRLTLLASDASRGRYRVEARLRADVLLEEPVLVVRVVSREPGAAAARAGGRERLSREPLALAPFREVRRELEVLTGAQEPVTVLVGIGGHVGQVRLHRTGGLDLGPDTAPGPPGTVRTDQSGQSYFEVRMPPAPR